MRALSIIGIIMSVVGMITCIYIMTEATCYCDCENDSYSYYSGSSVPGAASGGSLISMLIFIFFLVMSIVGVSKSNSNQPHLSQAIPPFQANPYPNYQQPYQQPQQYQNPYQQNPYQQNPYQNPAPPQQNPYQNPAPPTQNPYQNPYQNPNQDQTPPSDTPPPPSPWEPK